MVNEFLRGRGLHTGELTAVRFLGATSGAGLTVRRVDLGIDIAVACSSVVPSPRCTRLGVGAATVETVEHALATLVGLGIRDATIEVDGPEVPIFDGSALTFVGLAREAGLERAPRARLARAVRLERALRWIEMEPAGKLEVTSTIEFAQPLIGRSTAEWNGDPDEFARELAPARTFGFTDEVGELRHAGRILGGDLSCAVVFDAHRVVNEEGLRFANEPARHKLVDLLGDLALLAGGPCARVQAIRYGHSLGLEALTEATVSGR